jgi:ABC-type ATPase involved in cell division
MLSEVYRKGARRFREEKAAAALARVGLSARADYLPPRLSGGERQRVAIARAIMGSPRVLLCDEPTGNIDSAMTVAILDLFAELNRGGLTIITITHDSDVAERASHRAHIIDGRLRMVA